MTPPDVLEDPTHSDGTRPGGGGRRPAGRAELVVGLIAVLLLVGLGVRDVLGSSSDGGATGARPSRDTSAPAPGRGVGSSRVVAREALSVRNDTVEGRPAVVVRPDLGVDSRVTAVTASRYSFVLLADPGPRLFTSRNAITWTERINPTGVPVDAFADIEHHGEVFVAVGALNGRAAAWYSPTGVTWWPAAVSDAGASSSMEGVARTRDGLVAWGRQGRHALIWHSTDGERWERAWDSLSFRGPGEEGRTAITWVGQRGRRWVAGGVVTFVARATGSQVSKPAKWVSSNGHWWDRLPFGVEQQDVEMRRLRREEGATISDWQWVTLHVRDNFAAVGPAGALTVQADAGLWTLTVSPATR